MVSFDWREQVAHLSDDLNRSISVTTNLSGDFPFATGSWLQVFAIATPAGSQLIHGRLFVEAAHLNRGLFLRCMQLRQAVL